MFHDVGIIYQIICVTITNIDWIQTYHGINTVD